MILRNAENRARFTKRLAFTTSARVALRLLLQGIRFPAGTSMLLPAYIGITDREGSGVFDPVQATATPYTFYPLDDRLRPSLEVLEAMMRTGRHPVLLVVHYFGIVHVDLPELRELCLRHQTLLIEDCAHVSGPFHLENGPGSVGHAAFFSIHKAIAVSSGGVLRVNDPNLALPVPEGTDRCEQSFLEQLLRTDLETVAAKRRDNYHWLAQHLADVEGITVLYPAIGDHVPHDFPIAVHDGLRERLYFELLKEGLPTIALYYRLVDAITPDVFPLSVALSQAILNLPVHQDTDQADLEHLVGRLACILSRLRSDCSGGVAL